MRNIHFEESLPLATAGAAAAAGHIQTTPSVDEAITSSSSTITEEAQAQERAIPVTDADLWWLHTELNRWADPAVYQHALDTRPTNILIYSH